MFDKLSNPVPSNSNMFALIMELLISGHQDRTIVVAFNENRHILGVAELLEEISKPIGFVSGFG